MFIKNCIITLLIKQITSCCYYQLHRYVIKGRGTLTHKVEIYDMDDTQVKILIRRFTTGKSKKRLSLPLSLSHWSLSNKAKLKTVDISYQILIKGTLK